MYEEGWISDESGFDFIERFRRVLFDPTSSPEEQREAARILVQIGTDDAVDALHWFMEHGESTLAFDIRHRPPHLDRRPCRKPLPRRA